MDMSKDGAGGCGSHAPTGRPVPPAMMMMNMASARVRTFRGGLFGRLTGEDDRKIGQAVELAQEDEHEGEAVRQGPCRRADGEPGTRIRTGGTAPLSMGLDRLEKRNQDAARSGCERECGGVMVVGRGRWANAVFNAGADSQRRVKRHCALIIIRRPNPR